MSELKLQQCRLDGRYDILECLGRGSYAEVYLAHDAAAPSGAKRPVVIKALNLYLQGVPDADLERTLIENFRNEAIALDRVRHPNIISRLGHGTAIDLLGRTFHYLVLEYLPGGDMATLCRHHPLTLERALFYLKQICAGLAHAHEHGVIHRDIKPQNLLLTADQQIVKIADFGIAKIELDEGIITRVGTDVYAAPEHHPLAQTGRLDTTSLSHRPTYLTPAADVYSLAKTVYMLLTGETPRQFSQKPITELPVTVSNKAWAVFVLRVLRRATETNPEKRYQTVQDFWEELQDATMPQTQMLAPPNGESACSVSSENIPDEATNVSAAPSPPSFLPPLQSSQAGVGALAHPRIVVPLASATPQQLERGTEQNNGARATAGAAQPKTRKERDSSPPAFSSSGRLWRWLVALLLVAAFAGMLLATHYYVRRLKSRPPPTPTTSIPNTPKIGVNTPKITVSPVGREFVTTTDVNLRSGPNKNNPQVGLAEKGSRVRVVNAEGAWYEVLVLEHGGGENKDPNFPSDQGWLNSKYLRSK